MLLGATVSDCNVEIALLGFCAFFIDEIAEDLLGRTSPRLNLCNVLGTGVELKSSTDCASTRFLRAATVLAGQVCLPRRHAKPSTKWEHRVERFEFRDRAKP
jgi:hypothetical protein